MKKLFALLICTFFVCGFVFADSGSNINRISRTTTTYPAGTSTLVKRGDAEIYSIDFISTASNGNFYIMDSLTDSGTYSTVKAEGGQAVSGNSYTKNYGNNPLQLSTGLYLVVNDGYVVITYN